MNAELTTHPTAEILASFGLGKLNDADAEVVARHLAVCDACRQALDSVPADSSRSKIRTARNPATVSPSTPTPAPPQAPLSALRGPTVPPAEPLADLPQGLAEHPRFRVLRELGRGGMGIVYKAEHRLMERPVALKVINQSLLDRPEALERFRREVKAAAQLDHANIVRAHDAEQAGELHLLVMEYVEGLSLAQVLQRKGPLPVAHACNYVRQAALGLQHAFDKGMVHRDIKPQNLMLTPKGQVKILDFGLAQLASERQRGPGLTEENAVMGTPEYMAPEQAMDARAADIRADIYSLGCTLYCLLSGEPPFAGGTAIQIIFAHLNVAAPSLHEARPDVPAELAAVVARMLAKDPAQRFQKPVEVAQALAPFCKSGQKAPVGGAPPLLAGGKSANAGTVVGSDTNRPQAQRKEEPPPSARPSAPLPAPSGEAPLAELADAPSARRNRKRRTAARPAPGAWFTRPPVLVGVAAAVAVLALGIWLLAGTKDGTLVIEVNVENADVFVDGEKVTVTWAEGGRKAEVRVKPGTRKVEIKKNGFTVHGEEVTLANGGQILITARLDQTAPDPVDGGKQPTGLTDGFVPLFNGKDLTGWREMGDKGGWSVKNGELAVEGGTRPGPPRFGWLMTERDYSDFALRLEFAVTEHADSGVGFRCDPSSTQPVGQAEIQIVDEQDPAFVRAMDVIPFRRTGSLCGLAAERTLPSLERGRWNVMAVELRGRRLKVSVNDTVTVDTDLDRHVHEERAQNRSGVRRQSGPIGLQKMFGVVRFRNIQIQELPPRPSGNSSGGGLASAADDLQRMQGRWYLTAGESNGVLHSTDEVRRMKYTLDVQGDRFVIERLSKEETKLSFAGTVTLDAGSRPKRFDWTAESPSGGAGKWLALGLYEFDRDSLRLVYSDGERGTVFTRPTRFASSGEGGGTVVLMLKRQPLDISGEGARTPLGKPELVALRELPQNAYNSAPWLSPDGLTLYWQSTPVGERQRWVWCAERKNKDGLFENIRKLLPGTDPTVAADGLEMILLDGSSLYAATRTNREDVFSRPRKIAELDGLGFLAAPCLCADGLTLYADRVVDKKLELVKFTRPAPRDPWGKPTTVKVTAPGPSALRFFYVTADDWRGFCCIPDRLKDRNSNNLVMFSSNDQGKTFESPAFIELPGRTVQGKFPRYVAATKELFFSGEIDDKGEAQIL